MSTGAGLALSGERWLTNRMPGHWLLARLGKRVLRPGGLALTRRMLEALAVTPADRVVEFAPGLGVTARLTLTRRPATFTAVEEDEAAASRVQRLLGRPGRQCLVAGAAATRLPAESATVVYGEAMLTMQGPEQKRRIVAEAARLLQRGGRYGIHELALVPDGLDPAAQAEIQRDLSRAIHVGARPLTGAEWRQVLEREGLEIRAQAERPMRLLEPSRLLLDEGLWGGLRFGWRLLGHAEARRRVGEMRRVFLQHRRHLGAIMLVGVKRSRSHSPTGASASAGTADRAAALGAPASGSTADAHAVREVAGFDAVSRR